jgi:hypothetical protein
MKTATKISFAQIKELLPKTTSLYYVDYRDSLDEHTELIQQCINDKNADALYEKIDEWYIDGADYSIDSLNEELLSDLQNKFDIEEDEAKEIIEEFEEELRDYYYDKDTSDVLKDFCKNTRSIPIRVSMLSNYDCINSHWFEGQGGYSYKESYFGAMIDTLRLNPSKVKKMLVEKDVKVYGVYPNYKQREGKELVSYAEFWQELQNSCCGANLLTFVGLIDVSDLLENNFEVNKVTIPKGNNCGLYSEMQGNGSVIEMKLTRDLTIDLKKQGKTKYDTFYLELDESGSGYSIDNAYGVTRSFWGKEISFI